MKKTILDMCCGSKMFYFNKNRKDVVFCDIRCENHTLCDGRSLNIQPDVVCDFQNLPFATEQFYLVIFDPPHLKSAGENSYMAKKYGVLTPGWRDVLKKGFAEAFRVLKNNGTLIFKWNETQIKVADVLSCTDIKPIVGHISGKQSKTHWITFLKTDSIS